MGQVRSGRVIHPVLVEAQRIRREIGVLEKMIEDHQRAQSKALGDPLSHQESLEKSGEEILEKNRKLIGNITELKKMDGAANIMHVQTVNDVPKQLEEAFRSYKEAERIYRSKMTTQNARQIRAVYPTLTEKQAEIAAENTGGQVFKQAVSS